MSTLEQLGGTWTIDPTHSTIGFVARHAMISKVRGSFTEFTGTASVPEAGVTAASVTVDIAAASIDTANADRDGHVRGADFFDVEKYPHITFRSTKVQATGADTFEITGDLTIKDQTHPVTVPFEFTGTATDPFGNHRAGFEGSLAINRSDYGVTWNAALEAGGVMVSDKITLEFDISAIRQA